MRAFKFEELSEDIRSLVYDIPNLDVDASGNAEFRVMTQADPEWGNIHVPLALELVKLGAKKGETVLITGIE